VDEVFAGQVSSENLRHLHSLQRPLSPELSAVTLAADRTSVCVANRQALDELEGEMSLFVSRDTGAEKHLHKLGAPSQLALKVSCPVILLKNQDVSRGLVNGRRGTVHSMSTDCIHLNFDGNVVPIRRSNFLHYDSRSHQIMATRSQFPLTWDSR
jgi:hypothetical protein